MITNFKLFEDINDISYSVDDNVVCVRQVYLNDLIDGKFDIKKNYPEIGKKYKVLKCYDSLVMPIYYKNIYVCNLNRVYVNVIDDHNKICVGIKAKIFISEIEYEANKYNI